MMGRKKLSMKSNKKITGLLQGMRRFKEIILVDV